MKKKGSQLYLAGVSGFETDIDYFQNYASEQKLQKKARVINQQMELLTWSALEDLNSKLQLERVDEMLESFS